MKQFCVYIVSFLLGWDIEPLKHKVLARSRDAEVSFSGENLNVGENLNLSLCVCKQLRLLHSQTSDRNQRGRMKRNAVEIRTRGEEEPINQPARRTKAPDWKNSRDSLSLSLSRFNRSEHCTHMHEHCNHTNMNEMKWSCFCPSWEEAEFSFLLHPETGKTDWENNSRVTTSRTWEHLRNLRWLKTVFCVRTWNQWSHLSQTVGWEGNVSTFCCSPALLNNRTHCVSSLCVCVCVCVLSLWEDAFASCWDDHRRFPQSKYVRVRWRHGKTPQKP